jgi:hypothetical protein
MVGMDIGQRSTRMSASGYLCVSWLARIAAVAFLAA